ncbi:MAG: 4a-hydroxytetrahydrobiopterin dehydratase [Cognatishimia sp.]|uniref:4a-hydroxytetrahydrobiopterin dehydratase n=1 Tax=Cognatishimia sp. TaxID=2211648 RepID=UPI004059DB7D
MSAPLSQEARADDLQPLLDQGWAHDPARDAISKTFTFKSFIQAFGWMTQAAIWSEKYKHHPEWFNVYNRVDVVLTTHDVDGLSELDIKLARKMDVLAAQLAG